MFGFTQEPSRELSNTWLKTTNMVLLCSSAWTLSMLWKHVNLCAMCTDHGAGRYYNIVYVHADEHSRNILVVFSQVLDSSLMLVPV
jgi:hypothetical protein